MISSEHILTIGPEYKPPKGGIAQCIATYQQTIYSDFRCLTNSCDGGMVRKTCKLVFSLITLCFILAFHKKIRIIHIHTASYNSFKRSSLFVKVAKAMGRNVVLHIHGGGFKDYYMKQPRYVRSVLDKADALITLSTSWKMFFENIALHGNVHIVPNIISKPIYQKVKGDGKFHLLYMGQITKAKGVFDLVEMIAENKNFYRGKLILDIGGDMYEADKLRNFVSDNKIDDIVHLHGWLIGNAKAKMFNWADAYILPSYVEGVPISILEAESYGLPILSTRVGGIPDIVDEGKNGFLFTPGDKQDMKKAIDMVVENRDLKISMGSYSKELTQKNNPSSVEKDLIEVYRSL